MLIHNSSYCQPNGYYADQMYVPYGNPAPSQMDNYYHEAMKPSPTQQMYYSCQRQQPVYECACPEVPPQQSLLRQILTGKGYKNDVLCMGQLVKMEAYPDFLSTSCCYSNVVLSGSYSSLPHMQ